MEDKQKGYQNCSVLYCVTQIVHSRINNDMINSYRTILGLGFACFCVFTRVSLFVLGLVFLYFLFVVVWLSVPMHSVPWKDSSPK